eukprot:8474044-Pyramimonas_sp.AAC.1
MQLEMLCETRPHEQDSCRGGEGRGRGCTPNQNGAADCQGGAKAENGLTPVRDPGRAREGKGGRGNRVAGGRRSGRRAADGPRTREAAPFLNAS